MELISVLASGRERYNPAMARAPLKRSGSPASFPRKSVKEDPRFNTALARGLDILRAFKAGDLYLGNVELAERTGIPNSTISRFTHTLQELGYLLYVENLGRYQLGPSVLDLGFGFLANVEIQTLARPLMAELANECGGVISLACLDGMDVIYIEVARGIAPIMRRAHVGMRIPAAHTSVGWACLAGMPATEREAHMETMRHALGSDWPHVRKQILGAIAEIDQRGFCLNIGGRYVPVVNAIGAPVRAHNDVRHFAFNLTAPSSLLTRADLLNTWGPKLASLAAKIQSTSPR